MEIEHNSTGESQNSKKDKEMDQDSAGANTSGASNLSEEEQVIANLTTQLEESSQKFKDTQEKMLYLAADFENARKRWEKERSEVRTYAISEFARDLLPVMDAFNKAMESVNAVNKESSSANPKSLASMVEGIQLVSKVFYDTLSKHGIEKVPGKGQPFDPKYHNAIAKEVDASVTRETVAEEFVAGYKIGDRVLRTAMVKVAAPD